MTGGPVRFIALGSSLAVLAACSTSPNSTSGTLTSTGGPSASVLSASAPAPPSTSPTPGVPDSASASASSISSVSASASSASASSVSASSASASSVSTVAAADAKTAALAKAATLRLIDFGPSFDLDSPAADVTDTAIGCGIEPGGPYSSVGAGATRSGDRVHYGSTRWSFGSLATVFPTEADAKRWIGIRTSPAFIECRRQNIEDQQKASNPNVGVRIVEQGPPQKGIELSHSYRLTVTDNGSVRDANGTFLYNVLRVGRTVLTIQSTLVTDDKDPKNLATLTEKAVNNAFAQAYKRIVAAG